MLEEDDTLATEAAGKEDQNSTGLEALPDLGGTKSLADLLAAKQSMSERCFHYVSPWYSNSHFPNHIDDAIFPYQHLFPLDTGFQNQTQISRFKKDRRKYRIHP